MSGSSAKKLTPERKATLAILHDIRQNKARARDLMRAHPALAAMDSQLRAEVFSKVMCLVRLGTSLDGLIYAELDSTKKLKPKLLDIMRLAAYEMLYEEVPAHAAISQARFAAEAITPRLKGVVHAVLTHISDKYTGTYQASLSLLESYSKGKAVAENELLDALMFAAALPKWLARSYVAELSPTEIFEFAQAAFAAPLQSMVVNLFWYSPKEMLELLHNKHFSVTLDEAHPEVLLFSGASGVSELDLIEQARLIPADIASVEVVEALPLEAASNILEIGQGRATKTLLMQNRAHKLGGLAHIVSVELHAHKSELARERLDAAGVGDVCRTLCLDAKKIAEAKNQELIYAKAKELAADFRSFDVVFIDAPCTGTGTLARHPEIASALSVPEVGLSAYTASNLEFLLAAAPFVEVGKVLAYATCSILHAENEDVIEAFLKTDIGSHFKRSYPDLRTYYKGADKHFLAQLLRIR